MLLREKETSTCKRWSSHILFTILSEYCRIRERENEKGERDTEVTSLVDERYVDITCELLKVDDLSLHYECYRLLSLYVAELGMAETVIPMVAVIAKEQYENGMCFVLCVFCSTSLSLSLYLYLFIYIYILSLLSL